MAAYVLLLKLLMSMHLVLSNGGGGDFLGITTDEHGLYYSPPSVLSSRRVQVS
jgi:hypothetical protein